MEMKGSLTIEGGMTKRKGITMEGRDGDEEDDFGIWMTTENDYGGRMTINYGEMDDYGEEPV